VVEVRGILRRSCWLSNAINEYIYIYVYICIYIYINIYVFMFIQFFLLAVQRYQCILILIGSTKFESNEYVGTMAVNGNFDKFNDVISNCVHTYKYG
jgi:hypothetical protein